MVVLPDDTKWLHEQVLDTEELDKVLAALRNGRRHDGVKLMMRDISLRRAQLLEQLSTVEATNTGQIGRFQGGISAYDEVLSFFENAIEQLTPDEINEGSEEDSTNEIQ